MAAEAPRPTWLPPCPWPQEVWPTTLDEAGDRLRLRLGDQDTTAISGTLMRHGWELAERAILDRLVELTDGFRGTLQDMATAFQRGQPYTLVDTEVAAVFLALCRLKEIEAAALKRDWQHVELLTPLP